MKNTLITLTATALLAMGSVAIADEPTQSPVMMTDAQMDQMVAGDAAVWNIQNPGIDESKYLPTDTPGHHAVGGNGARKDIYQSTGEGTQVRICISDDNLNC
jgi:hypothetical protein